MKRPGNFSCRMSCLTLPDERSTGISLVPRVRSNLNGPTIEPKVWLAIR
jgi:hypothetical protein